MTNVYVLWYTIKVNKRYAGEGKIAITPESLTPEQLQALSGFRIKVSYNVGGNPATNFPKVQDLGSFVDFSSEKWEDFSVTGIELVDVNGNPADSNAIPSLLLEDPSLSPVFNELLDEYPSFADTIPEDVLGDLLGLNDGTQSGPSGDPVQDTTTNTGSDNNSPPSANSSTTPGSQTPASGQSGNGNNGNSGGTATQEPEVNNTGNNNNNTNQGTDLPTLPTTGSNLPASSGLGFGQPTLFPHIDGDDLLNGIIDKINGQNTEFFEGTSEQAQFFKDFNFKDVFEAADGTIFTDSTGKDISKEDLLKNKTFTLTGFGSVTNVTLAGPLQNYESLLAAGVPLDQIAVNPLPKQTSLGDVSLDIDSLVNDSVPQASGFNVAADFNNEPIPSQSETDITGDSGQ